MKTIHVLPIGYIIGLELAKRVKECKEHIRIAILSGFSEFEYAKAAIGIGVVDYLLKPIKVLELTKLIQSIAEDIALSEEKGKGEIQKRFQQKMESFMEQTGEETKFVEAFERFTRHTVKEKLLCGMFDVDTHLLSGVTVSREIIIPYLEKQIENEKEFFLLVLKGKLYVIAFLGLQNTKARVVEVFHTYQRKINHMIKGEMTISVGLSNEISGTHFFEGLKECKALLEQRLYLGSSQFLEIDNIKKENNPLFLLKKEEELRHAVITYNYEKAEKYIEAQFQTMVMLHINSYDLVKGICLNLKQLLFSYIQENGIDVEAILEKNQIEFLKIPDYIELSQYKSWILDLYYLVIKGISDHTGTLHNNVIISALGYISMNYSEDITVESISSFVKKSKNYFSYLFKKEMGISFIEYLNRYRVEEAKKQLDSSLDLTYEIALKVGFRDEKYFSMVFKKIAGCSPAAYRKKKGEER